MKNLPLVIWLLGWPAVFFGIKIEFFFGFEYARHVNILVFFIIWILFANGYGNKNKDDSFEKEFDELEKKLDSLK